MRVSDKVGNEGKARNIIFFDPINRIRISDDVTTRVSPGITSGRVMWVGESGELNLDWGGVFSNQAHVNSNYLSEAARLQDAAIDDIQGPGTYALALLSHSGRVGKIKKHDRA